jgi:hypothetical protein
MEAIAVLAMTVMAAGMAAEGAMVVFCYHEEISKELNA